MTFIDINIIIVIILPYKNFQLNKLNSVLMKSMGLIQDFELYKNHSNLFNSINIICWHAPFSSWQRLKIYDILGNEVTTLLNEFKPAGSYEIEFNASNLATGIYLYKLHTENFSRSMKMVLMK
jgi:hypothetical protein